jgi:hypothetical protein
MTLHNSITRPSTPVYSQISKRPGLLTLLAYALRHQHSSQWVGAIWMILAREGERR